MKCYWPECGCTPADQSAGKALCDAGNTPAADPERVAQLIAHRACCGVEHDPANGKLHGYCVVCGVPWPCEYAGTPPAPAATKTLLAMLLARPVRNWHAPVAHDPRTLQIARGIVVDPLELQALVYGTVKVS